MDKIQGRNLLSWLGLAIMDMVLVFFNQSTYDTGDSILHYLYAHQAIEYPGHFLNHWAKPVFVLLSSGFTVLGWTGIKLFNTFCILAATWFCFRLFQSYGINAWYAPLICFAAPHYFLVQSSGLTEPLFTLFLTAAVFYLKSKRIILALLLLSFLPFVRSEGWVIIPVVLVYLFQIRQFRKFPVLLLGTVIYSLAGLLYYGDLFWIFNQNPYAGTEEHYGSGTAIHYIIQLGYIVGFAFYFFLLLGLYRGLSNTFRSRISKHEFYLIYGIPIAYVFAHSVFWANGWFHSLGLNRVLIVIIPLLAFIAFRGIEQLACSLSFLRQNLVYGLSFLLLLVFPFVGNKSSFRFPSDFELSSDQKMAHEVKSFVEHNFGSATIYYGNVYFPFLFERDIDDPQSARRIGDIRFSKPPENSVIIWDNYFSVRDQGVEPEHLKSSEFTKIKSFNCEECTFKYMVEIYIPN